MALEDKRVEKEIGGVMYAAQPVPFVKGKPALLRLMRLISPLFAGALHGAGGGKINFAGVFDTLPQVLDDKEIEFFQRLFGEASWYKVADDAGERWVPLIKNDKNDGQSAHFDTRYSEFMQWLVFCAEVNFGGFFGGTEDAKKLFAPLIQMFKPESKVSIPGNGSGGGS